MRGQTHTGDGLVKEELTDILDVIHQLFGIFEVDHKRKLLLNLQKYLKMIEVVIKSGYIRLCVFLFFMFNTSYYL